MLPAHQGLEADQAAVGQAMDGLVMHAQLVLLQGPAQGADQLDALVRLFGQLLAVEGVGVAAAALGLEQRRVGIAQHLLDALGVGGEQGYPQAGADEQLVPAQTEGLGQLFAEAFGQVRYLLGLGAVLPEQAELVAAQARQGHAALQQPLQARADPLQQQVALGMAEAFVDVLEVIQVQQQQGAAELFAAGALQHMLDAFGEEQAVGQVGQRVVVGEEVQLMLGAFDRADIGEHRDIVGQLARLVLDGTDVLPERVDLAVLAPVPHLAAPFPAALKGVPHGLVEGRSVAAGAEDARIPAQHLGLLEAGDAGEGAVDMDDVAPRVGDQHAFLGGVEYRGGLAQAAFMGAARVQVLLQVAQVQAQQGVEQQAGDHDEEQALGGLQLGQQLGVAHQAHEQAVAEHHPETGEDEIGQHQFQGAELLTHGLPSWLGVNAGRVV
ncbi:hypothetical protein D3C84_330150 [compost metagenome]